VYGKSARLLTRAQDFIETAQYARRWVSVSNTRMQLQAGAHAAGDRIDECGS
jgi:hypothetical protein